MMNSFKNRICILLALLLVTLASQAQPWVRKAGTRSVSFGESIARDNSGNVYVTGIFSCDLYVEQDTLFNITCGDTVTPPSLIPRYDGFIIKYDNDGNQIWARQIIGDFANTHLILSGVSVTASGESYVTGYYKGDLDFDGTAISNTIAASDFFIAKYGASGNVLWVRSGYAREADDSIKSNAIDVDASGNCYVGGMVMEKGVFNGDADTIFASSPELFVLKLDASGNHEWVFGSEGDGSGASAEIKDLQVDADENLFLTGRYTDTLTILGEPIEPPAGGNRVFISKIGPDSTFVWWSDAVATSSNAISLDQSGEFLYVTGSYLTNANFSGTPLTAPAGSYGTFIARYDTTGTFDWAQKLQVAAADSAVVGYGVSCDEFGAAYVTGIFGKNNSTNAVVTNGTKTLNGESSMDVFLAKYTDAGALHWMQMLGENLVDGAKDIVVSDSMNIFVTGYFSERVIVDSMQVENSGGGVNAFTAKIDPCPFFYARATAAGTTTFCEGDSVLLQATTGTGLNYQWQLNGTDIPGATTANYYAKDSAYYRVKMWHNNPLIVCTKYSLAVEVTVNPLPNVAVAADGDTTFCEGDYVTLSTGVGNKYQWYEGGAMLTIADTSYNYMATVSGDYQVVSVNIFGCKDTSVAKTVTVHPYPLATITPPGKSIICAGDTVFMSANAGVDYTYQWFKNGSILANDTLQTFKAYVSGIFTVAVSNEIGCTTTSANDTVSVISSPPATLSYSGSLTYCIDQPIILYANSGIGLTYQWQHNSIDIAGAESSTYQPFLSGTYQVIVTNNFNCSTTSTSATTVVNPQPVASFTTPLPANVCNGDSLLFTAGAGPGYMYQWYRNGVMLSATNAAYYAKTGGSYSLVVTDGNGCADTTAASVQVTVFGVPLATITITGATAFCAGDSVRLSANSGSNLTYQWYRDGNIIGGATVLTYYAKTSGDYQVRVTNINSCSRTSSIVTVTVYTFPTASITPLDPLTFCQGVGADLQANTGTGLTYQWKKNNINISGANASLFHATEAGSYTVLVSVGSSCSVLSSSVTVAVNPVTKPIITTNGSNISTSFFPTYQWYKDGVAISGATLQIYNVVENGSYTVEVTNPNSCVASSDAVTVCVPVPEIEVSGALLQSSSGASYQWYIEDVLINGAVAQNYLCQISGNYKVRVTDGNGCSSFSVPVLVCVPPPTITLGANNVLTASNGITFQWYLDGVALAGEDTRIMIAQQTGSYVVEVENFDGCISSSMPLQIVINSTHSAIASGLEVYPNPAKDKINITYAPGFSNEVSVSISDLSGSYVSEVLDVQHDQNALTIELNSLPNGMYLLHVKDRDTYKVTLVTISK